jgi:hypothetical protein
VSRKASASAIRARLVHRTRLLAAVATFVEHRLEPLERLAEQTHRAFLRLHRAEAQLGRERPHVGGEAGRQQRLSPFPAKLRLGLVQQAK